MPQEARTARTAPGGLVARLSGQPRAFLNMEKCHKGDEAWSCVACLRLDITKFQSLWNEEWKRRTDLEMTKVRLESLVKKLEALHAREVE